MSSSYCSFIDMTGEKAKVIPTSKACFFISRVIQRRIGFFGAHLNLSLAVRCLPFLS